MNALSSFLLAASLLLGSSVSLANEHDAHSEATEHAEGGHAEAGHSEGHGHHVPHFSDINWFNGLIGEKEGVEPSLLWRPPGTPVPLGALLINTAILFFLIGKYGGPAIVGGLSTRKQRIAGEILAASKMKEEAEEQLAHYEGKLKEMTAELDRIKKEMREQAEADRERILSEAKKHREVLEAEASQMVAQELAQARHEAIISAVSHAVEAARQGIAQNLGPQDHERLAQGLLTSLEHHLSSENKS